MKNVPIKTSYIGPDIINVDLLFGVHGVTEIYIFGTIHAFGIFLPAHKFYIIMFKKNVNVD